MAITPSAAPASNVTEYTVSGISAALKRTVEDAFGNVRVRGEISGYRGPHSSGHAYFSLKDDKARLEAVVWRTTMLRLKFRPQEGLEVIAVGKLSTFPGKSSYQLVIDSLEPAGVGALMALLEERRRRLAAEGLFAAERKKPLPFLPRVIGVVTSPTGAVIRDILHRLSDRFPVRVMVWPVRVQGEAAAQEVAEAIAGFNAIGAGGPLPRPDLIIVARGGGSLEDLWAFNEEIVVRAAAASAIPLISAVGHETDVTLIDHAADLRAPTPTGAAELAVPVRSELLTRVEGCAFRHSGAITRFLALRDREVQAAARALPGPADILGIPRRSLDELAARLGRSLGANTLAHRAMLGRTAARLSRRGLETLTHRCRERLQTCATRSTQAFRTQAGARRVRFDGVAGRHGPRLLEERAALLRRQLAGFADRKGLALSVHAERKRAGYATVCARLRPQPLRERLAAARRQVGDAGRRSWRALGLAVTQRWQRLEALDKLLDAFALSKESILARGYALIHGPDGGLIRAAREVPRGAALDIEFADGRIAAMAGSGAAMPRRPRRRIGDSGQASLFDPPDDPKTSGE